MKYGEQLIQALWGRKEIEKQTFLDFASQTQEPPYTEEIQAEGIRICARVRDIDRFGLLLENLDLVLTEEVSLEGQADRIEEQLNQICEKIPYLDGFFQRVEFDRDSLNAVLRTEPTKDAEKSYFELEFFAGREVRIRHFTMEGEKKQRKATAANISVETLCKLTDQLVEILKPMDPM